MDKKDWLTIGIGVATISGGLLTGLIQLESRISKMEAQNAANERTRIIIRSEMAKAIAAIGRLEGRMDERREQE